MIRKLSLISLFTLLPASFYYAQTTVYAYVQDLQGKPVESAEVDLAQSVKDVTADKIGYFQFVDLMPGHYQITIAKPNFESKTVEFDVLEGEKRKDLGIIQLGVAMSDAGVIVIDDSAGDIDEGGSAMQPTVGLLSSGRDVFQNVSAFELGAYWFRPRGVENRFEDILFNGIPMSKNDDGKVDFSNWGGLNDVTRYPYENVDNITPSEYTFGNLGGVVYYNTRASSYRKQTSLAYSFTNRSYFHRAMATYSSGLTKNGWAFTFSGSRRWADDGVIDGTYQDAYAYFGAIEKQFSDRHAINLTAFGAPTYRAGNSPNTQETFDIMGKNYNEYWGWQDGEKRNSRIRKVFEPIFMITDYLKLGKTSNWTNTLSYQVGKDSRSRLDWFHAADPKPTYYRKMPGYLYNDFLDTTSDGGATITDAEQAQYDAYVNQWRTDPNTSQINWMSLYDANYQNKEIGARYTVVADVNKDKTLNFASHFDTKLASNWKLNLNFNFQNLKSDNFREIVDLLGADYANDQNAFNYDAPNDIDNPNRKLQVGDRTQYSYDLLRNMYAMNVSSEVDLPKWNFMASVFSSYSESQRDGKFNHAVYNSKGKSELFDAFDAGLKGRITYKINGKNFIVYNGAFFSLAPTLNEIFISPRVTNMITPSVQNQIINSNDLSYILRGQILKIRLGAYYTKINNATEVSRYFADYTDSTTPGSSTSNNGDALIAEILSGVDKEYKGVELGAEVKITPTLTANAVASVGDYRITNNPLVSTFSDEFSYERWGNANIKNYKIAGTPQKAYSAGLRYNSTKFWWIGASANYLQDQYLDFSAINKTPKMYTNPLNGDNYGGATPETIARLTAQQKFEDQFMLNANAGKSFLFGKYRAGISISVNNILNNRDYVTGGFEQGRNVNFPEAIMDANRKYPYFGPKLWYDRGRTFFANVYLRF